jgi:hypothetical protein
MSILPNVSKEAKLGDAYRTGGMRGFRIELISKLTSGTRPESYRIAQSYAALDDKESALKWLADSYAKHEFEFLFFYVDPVFADLRGDPRFEEFIGRLLPT